MNTNILDKDVFDDDNNCLCGYEVDKTLSSNLPQCRTCWLFDEKNKKRIDL